MCFENNKKVIELFSEMFFPGPGAGIRYTLPPKFMLHTPKLTLYNASNLRVGGSRKRAASNLEQI